jgi:hypothetical protein
LRKTALLAVMSGFFFLTCLAQAQQGDAMFGFGTLASPGADECQGSPNAELGIVCPEKGGLYTNIGADVIFHKRVGFGFDAVWRGGQGDFAGSGQPYRPILFDFNGVWQPRISKKVGADLMGGIGWQTTRFYVPYCTNGLTCNPYVSSNHFLVDIGGGIRYYVWGHVFLRPEAHFYHILNSSDVYTSGNVLRLGASIGYTIGPD